MYNYNKTVPDTQKDEKNRYGMYKKGGGKYRKIVRRSPFHCLLPFICSVLYCVTYLPTTYVLDTSTY